MANIECDHPELFDGAERETGSVVNPDVVGGSQATSGTWPRAHGATTKLHSGLDGGGARGSDSGMLAELGLGGLRPPAQSATACEQSMGDIEGVLARAARPEQNRE